MKTKNIILAVILSVAIIAVCMVGCTGTGHTQNLQDQPLEASCIADYTKDASARSETFASGSKGFSWENGEPFNVWWKADNVSYDNNLLSLSLSEMTTKEQAWNAETETMVDCTADYYGAEERSYHYYGYGDFEVRMKPAKIVGTASTFFICTGPYDQWKDEDGNVIKSNDHDEIDIEFLGKDTTKVQFNYFASGKGGHEYMYDLGFDASEEFHNYGFRWTDQYITWFVDGKPVYKVYRSEIKKGEEWPEEAGRVIMNYWCGTRKAAAWMGTFKDDYSGSAQYEWVKVSSQQNPDPNTYNPSSGTPDQPEKLTPPSEGWTEISYDGFDGWGMYEVDKTNGLTISHQEAKNNYKCCGMSLENSYTWVKFNIKNNQDTNADLRVDLKVQDKANGVEAVVENDNVTYNQTDSAINIHLGANEQAEVIAKIKNIDINQMVVFFNSTDSSFSATGSVTITGLMGVVSQGSTDPTPVVPENWEEIDLSSFDGWGTYTVTKENGVQIVHNEAVGTYSCCGADIVFTGNLVKVVIKNNSTQTAYVKVCVKNGDDETSSIVSATVNGETLGYVVYGALAVIPANQEAVVIMEIDLSKNPNKFVVSFNSEGDQEMPTSGDITILGVYKPAEKQEGEWNQIDLSSFDGWGTYTVTKENGVQIVHSEAVGTYSCCGADIVFTGNLVKVVIKNNSTQTAYVKVCVKNGNDETSSIVSATVNGEALGYVVYGALAVIPANQEAVVIMEIDLSENPNKFVVSFNSEGDQEMPTSGDITILGVYQNSQG